MSLIENEFYEIKFCPSYGLYKIVKETSCYIFIRKYDDIIKFYNNYCLLEYGEMEKFYIFDNKLGDDEIKVSKKTFKFDEIRTKVYFLKKGDIYVKKYDEIIIMDKEELFYSNYKVREFCVEAKAYCKHLDKIIYWEEEYLNAPQNTKEYNLNVWKSSNEKSIHGISILYGYLEEDEKKYVKNWLKSNIRKYYGYNDDIPYGRVIKMFFKDVKNKLKNNKLKNKKISL